MLNELDLMMYDTIAAIECKFQEINDKYYRRKTHIDRNIQCHGCMHGLSIDKHADNSKFHKTLLNKMVNYNIAFQTIVRKDMFGTSILNDFERQSKDEKYYTIL